MHPYLQVTTALGSRPEAEQVAQQMVDEHLAACAQVTGPVASTYRWQGRIESAEEWYCHLKTTAEAWPLLERRLRELHPYEVPEIIALALETGSAEYLEWIAGAVNVPR